MTLLCPDMNVLIAIFLQFLYLTVGLSSLTTWNFFSHSSDVILHGIQCWHHECCLFSQATLCLVYCAFDMGVLCLPHTLQLTTQMVESLFRAVNKGQ